MKITNTSKGIKLERAHGTWYTVDKMTYNATEIFILENEKYGNDVPFIAVTASGQVVCFDVYQLSDVIDEMDYRKEYGIE